MISPALSLRAHVGIAKTYASLKQTDNAIAEYRSIIERDTASSVSVYTPWAHFHLGEPMLSQGKLEQARAEWTTAMEGSEKMSPTFNKRDISTLRQQVEHALATNPSRAVGK